MRVVAVKEAGRSSSLTRERMKTAKKERSRPNLESEDEERRK
jgi:hypothetical protein